MQWERAGRWEPFIGLDLLCSTRVVYLLVVMDYSLPKKKKKKNNLKVHLIFQNYLMYSSKLGFL